MANRVLTVLGRYLEFSSECVHFRRDARKQRGGAERALYPRQYPLEHVPKRAKELRVAFGRNRDFCDFDPPLSEGSKPAGAGPAGPSPLLLCQ